SLLMSYEDWPKATIIEQKSDEVLFLIRGKDTGRAAWHYIIVSHHNLANLKAKGKGSNIDITDFGRILQYRNNRDQIKPASGWGTNPPRILQNWLDVYYVEDLPSSLARRAGLKSYDRIIFLNGVNIENDSQTQFNHRFDIDRHLPVEMLVCNPATYEHYKANQKIFHFDLPTIQRLKPIYATSTSDSITDVPAVTFDNETFYAIQWENSNMISTVCQSAVFKSPEFTNINDICLIEIENEQYRKGKIIFRGSRSECDKFNTSLISSAIGNVSNMIDNLSVREQPTISSLTDDKLLCSLDEMMTLSSQKHQPDTKQKQTTNNNLNSDPKVRSIIENHQDIGNRTCTIFEDLPNELFYYLFTLIDIQNLYKAFWGLNSRLNNIFQSCQNLSLIVDEKVDPLWMKLYAPYVTRLVIQTSAYCNFNQFSNLRVLVFCVKNLEQLTQIQPNTIPNLTYLSFLFGSQFTLPEQLTWNVFSNEFPFLRHVNLGRIKESIYDSWINSPLLRFVSILSCKPMFIPVILTACPNLDRLQVHVINDNNTITSSSPVNHPLRRLTLWSDSTELTFDAIDKILTHTSNIEYLYLQTIYSKSLIDLAHGLINRLHHLTRFGCHIREMLGKDERIDNLTSLHQVHSCFNRIQSIVEHEEFRILATK
ncbi:unnamed protein product, partial [Rotaria sordida]